MSVFVELPPQNEPPYSYSDAKAILLENTRDTHTVFRGQKNTEWGLMPSFTRLAHERNWSFAKSHAMEKEMLSRFREECINEGVIDDSKLNSDLTVKTLAQHHGLPTRLLDWTYSPYIAMFFAFDGCGNEHVEADEVAVWSLNWEKFEQGVIALQRSLDASHDHADQVLQRYYQSSLGVCLVRHTITVNERVRRQKGVFTQINFVGKSLHEFATEYSEFFGDETITRVRVCKEDHATAIRDLRLMGIEPSSIMRDIDGVACSVFNQLIRFLDCDTDASLQQSK